MAQLLAALLVLSLLASVALAAEQRSRALSVTCRGPLPFDQQQLSAAIQLRLPLMKLKPRAGLELIKVKALPRDRASITAGASSRVVSLKGLSSADAARIVALLTLDLISSQQHAATPPQPPAARDPRGADRFFVGLSPRISLGVSQWSPTFEPTIDAGVKVSRHFLVYFEGGITWADAGAGETELNLLEVPLRLGAGFRYSWFEARAGAALRPYFVSGAGQDQGVLAGGTVGLYFRRAFGHWFAGYAALGVDFFALRKEFTVGGEGAISTSWAVPWLGLGAGWQGG